MKMIDGLPSTEPTSTAFLAAGSFELGSLLGYRLLRLSTTIGDLADREAREVAGLSLPEYRVLVVMRSKGASGVTALQEAMLIDKAWISRTLTGLCEKGLVVSRQDAKDGRRIVFNLTARGKRSAEALIVRALERQRRILDGFGDEEVRLLMAMLSRIQANVDRSGG